MGRGRDTARAVHDGLGRVSGVITSAALIMIAVFGSFVAGGQRLTQEFGTGLAGAVALDALLVRFALVPSIMYILGDRNWWFPRQLRWVPRLHIEPEPAGPAGPAGPAIASPVPGDRPA